jgi:hypothetical protein
MTALVKVAATVNDRPVFSSERVPHNIKHMNVWQ